MKYYRVKPCFDNVPRYYWRQNGATIRNSVLIANELYTPYERSKIANRSQMFEIVEIPKSRVFFSFGARFEMGR